MVDRSSGLKDALVGDLAAGRWQAGDRLPTEREFCTRYQVGRATVRRALGEIKAMGLISQTVGSGTFVTPAVADRLRPEPDLSPAMLMDARLVLEPALIDLVVRHATAADFAALATCCDRADAAETLGGFEQWDAEFHLYLARASHNVFLTTVFAQMSRARETAEWGSLKRRSVTAERRLAYGLEHRAILSALRDRDGALAMAGLRNHLLNVRRNLFDEAQG